MTKNLQSFVTIQLNRLQENLSFVKDYIQDEATVKDMLLNNPKAFVRGDLKD